MKIEPVRVVDEFICYGMVGCIEDDSNYYLTDDIEHATNVGYLVNHDDGNGLNHFYYVTGDNIYLATYTSCRYAVVIDGMTHNMALISGCHCRRLATWEIEMIGKVIERYVARLSETK